jgi:hypothetical protein
MFGCKPDEVNATQYLLAKKGVHAGNYGQGPESAAAYTNAEARDTWGRPGTGIVVTVADMRRVQETYFMLAPEIKSIFWAGVRDELNRSRTLTTLFGRKRTFFGRWESKDDSTFLNAAYSFIPQGTIGDLCAKAMVEIDHALQAEGLPAHVLVNVHDSLLVQCKDDPEIVEHVAKLMEREMNIPIPWDGGEFYIPTDCKVGWNWGDMGKDGSNPRGLRDINKWLDAQAKISLGG